MNEDQNSETLRESLEEQFCDLNEALPDLDLKAHLTDWYRDICEDVARIEIEFKAMRQIVNHKLGITE